MMHDAVIVEKGAGDRVSEIGRQYDGPVRA
jgi:hypothetical protein